MSVNSTSITVVKTTIELVGANKTVVTLLSMVVN